MTQAELLEHRAFDAVARCLIRHLTVPKIYFEAPWPDPSHQVDILAVDRGGAGDVHVVEVKQFADDAIAHVPRLVSTAGAFKWLAVFAESIGADFETRLLQHLVPSDGLGKIGLISITHSNTGLCANIKVNAERFPNSGRAQAVRFVGEKVPDIEFGGQECPAPENAFPRDESSLDTKLAEIRELQDGGHQEAALLLAWSVLEGVMRRAAEARGDRVARLPSTQLVRLLRSYDLFTDAEVATLQDSSKARSDLAHGFMPAVTPQGVVQTVLDLIQKLRHSLTSRTV
jgi:hypothetical protein